MNELETIIECINGLGEAGITAFIWWVCLQIGHALITGGSILAAVFIISRTIICGIRISCNEEGNRTMYNDTRHQIITNERDIASLERKFKTLKTIVGPP